jgi:hypothetical protein
MVRFPLLLKEGWPGDSIFKYNSALVAWPGWLIVFYNPESIINEIRKAFQKKVIVCNAGNQPPRPGENVL